MFNNDNNSGQMQMDTLKKYGKIAAGVVISGFLVLGAVSNAIVNDNSFVINTLTSIGAKSFVDSTKSKHLNKVLEETDDFYSQEEISFKGSFYAGLPTPIFMDVSDSKQMKILDDLFIDGKLSNIITANGTLEELYTNAPDDIKKLLRSSIQEVKYRYTSMDHRQAYNVTINPQRIQTLLEVNSDIQEQKTQIEQKISTLETKNTPKSI